LKKLNNLFNGLCYGTHVGYTGLEKSWVSHNLVSATQHPNVVSTNLAKEINLGQVVVLFNDPPIPNLQFTLWARSLRNIPQNGVPSTISPIPRATVY